MSHTLPYELERATLITFETEKTNENNYFLDSAHVHAQIRSSAMKLNRTTELDSLVFFRTFRLIRVSFFGNLRETTSGRGDRPWH